MVENFQFVARNCLEWNTDSPLLDSPRQSPILSLLGFDWYFQLNVKLQAAHNTTSRFYGFNLSVHTVEKKELLNEDTKLIVYVTKCNFSKSLLLRSIRLKDAKATILSFGTYNLEDYLGRWTVHCVFSTDLPIELPINRREAVHLSNLPALEGQQSATPNSIVMKAKLAASAPDDSLSDVENLSFDFSKLLEQKSTSDVTLTCGERTFCAHRIILAARSDVFAAMFQNKMIESKTGSIEIKDIDGDILELLLKYVYTGKISDLSVNIASRLYMAADKYSVQSLKNTCSKWMLGSLTEENCLDFLLLADACSDKRFENRLINFIAEILNVIGEPWLKFTEKNPQLALSVYQRYALNNKKV